jgi:hypothetical protein
VEKPAIKAAAIQTTDYYSAQKNTEMNEDLWLGGSHWRNRIIHCIQKAER